MNDEGRLRASLERARTGGEQEWLELAAWCYASAWLGRLCEAVRLGVEDEPVGETVADVAGELLERPMGTPAARQEVHLHALRTVDAALAHAPPGSAWTVPLPPDTGLQGTVRIERVPRSHAAAGSMHAGAVPMRYDTWPSDHLTHTQMEWDAAPSRRLVHHDRDPAVLRRLLDADPLRREADRRAHRVALCWLDGTRPTFATAAPSPGVPHDHFYARAEDPLPSAAVDAILAAASRAEVGVVLLPEFGVRPTADDVRRWRGRARLLVAGSWHRGGPDDRENRAPVIAAQHLWDHVKCGEASLLSREIAAPWFPDAPVPEGYEDRVEERIRRATEVRTLSAPVWGRFAVATCADLLSPSGVTPLVLAECQWRVDTLFVPSFSPKTLPFVEKAQELNRDGASVFYVNNGSARAPGTLLAFAAVRAAGGGTPPMVGVRVDRAGLPGLVGWDHKTRDWAKVGRVPGFSLHPDLGMVVDLEALADGP